MVHTMGGGAATKGLKERLDRELQMNAPPSVKLRVVSPATAAERRHSAWLGGSILSSLGSFQQMWMSKQEYEEHGANLVHRKCP